MHFELNCYPVEHLDNGVIDNLRVSGIVRQCQAISTDNLVVGKPRSVCVCMCKGECVHVRVWVGRVEMCTCSVSGCGFTFQCTCLC